MGHFWQLEGPLEVVTSRPGHHMVSGTLALLNYSVIYMNVKQGSSHDRVQSPVEWGEIPYVHPFVRLSIHGPVKGL